jgi:2-polyprenyl-6-methoxyphenol hydroxylase-like FAD-dependent oxidoreductase
MTFGYTYTIIGANMAIEDGFVLSILLARYSQHAKDGHQEAFYKYVQFRYPQASKVANESYHQSKIGQWRHPLLVKLREYLIRLTPASVLQSKLRRVNMWDCSQWMTEFKALTR